MEAAPKLNIIFCSASCLLYTPESHSFHLTSLHNTQALSGNHLFCILSSGELYHIIHYTKSQGGQSSAQGGRMPPLAPPPPLNEALTRNSWSTPVDITLFGFFPSHSMKVNVIRRLGHGLKDVFIT